MRILRLAHRWMGGLIGLLLAVLGLSGALLMHEDAFLRATVPHAADPQAQDPATLGAALTTIFADPAGPPRSVVLASQDMGLHKLAYGPGNKSGAYTDQSGQVVERWSTIWERPEVWLFDLHHHLLIGETGDLIAGIAALAGMGFVITGLILWWPTRRLFALRLWPRKLTRAGVVHQHRDLGVVVAPILFLSLFTGATMTLDWFEALVTRPFSTAAEMKAGREPPKTKGGPLSPTLDWTAVVATAQAQYPGAELRTVGLPAKPGGLVSLRLRQQPEWLPNGRTFVWFDPATGAMVAHRDALTLPTGLQITYVEYPLHAGKVGGLPYRLVMTVSGLALTLLGTLAVVTFWGNPSGMPKRRRKTKAS